MAFPNNNFCFKIEYFKFKDGLLIFSFRQNSMRDRLPPFTWKGETTVKKCETLEKARQLWKNVRLYEEDELKIWQKALKSHENTRVHYS